MIAPGGTVGILGGGQLGRMLAVAGARLGYRVHVFAPEEDSPAADVAAAFTRADYEDAVALDAFARAVDVVTYEWENVPVAAVARLAAVGVPVRPGARSLEVAQDRATEKRFAEALGGRAAPWRAVDDARGLVDAVAALGCPAILKSRRMGYDGKGQAAIGRPEDADAAWAAIGGVPCVLEGRVAFAAEFSILVARGLDGARVVYDACENTHRDGILRTSVLPASDAVLAQAAAATALAGRIADALDHVGLLACEFFACADGPVFNEMAPRVHNSGHWSIEGAVTCQFENHVRAVCGLPLGSAALRGAVRMENLIGDDVARWPDLLAAAGARPHLYGKRAVEPGRKMGHVTWLP